MSEKEKGRFSVSLYSTGRAPREFSGENMCSNVCYKTICKLPSNPSTRGRGDVFSKY